MSAGSASDCTPEAPYVDREQIDGLIAAAGIAGAREILEAFWRSTDQLLAELKEQLATGDLDGAVRSAHSLKGSAMNVGAARFSLAARAIEDACRSRSASSATAALPMALDDYNRTVVAFAEAFAARR